MYYKTLIASGSIILCDDQHNDSALYANIDVTGIEHEIIKALVLQLYNCATELRRLVLCEFIDDFTVFIENKTCCFIKQSNHPLITISISNSDLI